MHQVIESKPKLVTHFLHTRPALSDFNSVVPITTNNQNGINLVNSNQAPITNTTSKLNPTSYQIETQGPCTEPVNQTLLKTKDRIDTPEGEEESNDDDLVLNLKLDEKYMYLLV
ncbi:hypothetical protein CROQUDRAFT_98572 [Cronartium quercuum f. sp. fusiforme G11]|uniref:Uncharacterized protein n=1 Tax=Cronartium quercuum f. sp. fusiforme G11 TaxID=708437 RepID=A0A9P6N801_9BASI|nr:hypothetical protein CROQUDRAFT_98572 [Cronartium quercuum f. sp. fusiforme G11]